jgi:hypothetical protein
MLARLEVSSSPPTTTTNEAYTEISVKIKKNEADAKGSRGFRSLKDKFVHK